MKIVYFDTETTGLDCRGCQIIELAMITYVNGVKKSEYDEFIKTDKPLPSKITEITGITDQMLSEGKNESDVAYDLKEKLTPGTLMIAHNCQFDLSFVYNLLKRHYPLEADSIVGNVDWLDTLTVLKDRKEYPHKLIDAVNYYNIEEVNFHRAIDDTKALVDVTHALKNERDDLEEYINIFGFNPKWGVSGEKFSFIQYKRQFYTKRMVSPINTLPNK